ncbi:MAG: Cache 3/Cache 2 fusion domain-containing protein [Candidatus Omnitrophica bacterium]|nr:Cache 3/Cache 2 fusion domain-containing protein [Candidatus Omnitrophota bacterium]
MRIATKFSLITAALIVIVCALFQVSSFLVFSHKIDSLIYENYKEKVVNISLLAYEKDELFFEGTLKDQKEGKNRVIDKLRILYRNQKNSEFYPFVIKSSGDVVVHPTLELGQQIFDKSVLDMFKKTKSGSFEYVYKGVPKWYVFEKYEPWDWVICMTTTVGEKPDCDVVYVLVNVIFFAYGSD